jgi:hypothetical protein
MGVDDGLSAAPPLRGVVQKSLEEGYVTGQKPVDMETVLFIYGAGAEDAAAEDNEAAIDVLTTLHN